MATDAVFAWDPTGPRSEAGQAYASFGVAHYWIADPAARTLETYRLDPATKLWVDSGAFDATARARVPPFEAVELDLARVFPPAPKDV